MRNIIIEALKESPVSQHQVEMVERKGIGHPDSICDAIMESISLALSREYKRRFGHLLHYNIDKGLLIAGRVKHRLGGGEVTEPMQLIIGDRATFEMEGQVIPVADIAVQTAHDWFEHNLRFIDPDKHVEIKSVLKPGSQELADIFHRQGGVMAAGDTSAAVGYAPLSPTEAAVLETEQFLNSAKFKEDFPETGEDVKVMGCRAGRILHLTIAMPLLDRFIDSEEKYFSRKQEIIEAVRDFVGVKHEEMELRVYLNTLDEPGRGQSGMYLTVLGTSAEDADSGAVGRGNRVNGLIAVSRPLGTEAAAGKNPVSHIGKIYSILTHKIAGEVYDAVPGIMEVYIWLCSQIGSPIDQPRLASAQLILEPGVALDTVSRKVADVIDRELAQIGKFCDDLLEGKYHVW